MNVRSRKRGSLAAAIVRTTLLIGIITITATVTVSLVSSYRLASAQAAERQKAYLRVAQNLLEARLAAASEIADSVRASVETSSSEREITRVLASQYAAANVMVDQLLLVTEDSEPIAAYPRSARSISPTDTDLRAVVADKRNGFYYDAGGDGAEPRLWVMRPVSLDASRTGELLVHMRTSFVSDIADQVASADGLRSAYIVQRSEVVTSGAGSPVLRLRDIEYGQLEEDGVGDLKAVAPAIGGMQGYYVPLQGFPGLPWRVLVAEPSDEILKTSGVAIAPGALVLVFGGLIAIGFSVVLSRRLLRPLRQIESVSLEAAAGAYVPALQMDRDDEIGRLADAFNVVALRLNALHDVSRLLASASKTTQVLNAIVESVAHLIGSGAVAVYLRDAPERFHLSRMSGDETARERLPISRDEARTLERSVASGALLMPPRGEVPELLGDAQRGFGRALVAPLVVGEERLGVVVVEQTERQPFTEAELEMVRTFTAQAAVALLNSRLFEAETVSREIAERLRLVAHNLVRPVDLDRALASALEQVVRLLGGREVLLAVRNRGVLGLRHSTDPLREGVVIELAARFDGTGTPGVVTATGSDEITGALLSRLGSSSAFIEEVAPGTPYSAVLAVLEWESGQGPDDAELVNSVSQVLDLALENAYFVERDRARARNLETILRISQAVGSSLEVRVVLNRVLDVVQMIFAADAVSLMNFDESRRTLGTAMARGDISETILHFEVEPGDDIPGRVFSSGSPLLIGDVDASASTFERAAAAIGLRSILAVPLLARGRPIGVLSVFSAGAEAYDEEDMGLLQTFAAQAALAIDTAQLYGRVHDVADMLQRSILPDQLPEYPEVDMASAYEPAGHDAEIGGDYYEVFRSPDGEIVLAMADVCGKGVSAATKTSMIRYSVRALVAAGLGPGACIAEINNLVSGRGDPGDIVTVIVGFLDAVENTLTWANGGHPPGLLLQNSTGQIVRLDTTGPLLGAMAGARFDELTVQVRPGDSVLLYTDGVTESRNGDRFFGEGRVRRVLKYGGSAEAVTQRLLATLHRFAPGALRDDVAVLTVRLRETGASEPARDAKAEVRKSEAT